VPDEYGLVSILNQYVNLKKLDVGFIAWSRLIEAARASNHGGRQLDGAPAPIDQIVAVRNAVGDAPDVICDGGIRRGSDVVKALALGATACSIGRPYLFGLAAGGEPGVDRLLTLLHQEFVRTLALAGINDIAALSRRHIRHRRSERLDAPLTA
jgi:L-lactate dehydrogenase (cytochrome)